METENAKDILDIRIVPQSTGTNCVILVTESQLRADILKSTLGDELVLSYFQPNNDVKFYLNFEAFRIVKSNLIVAVEANPKTLNWMNWIDGKTVTDVWVGYPDGYGGVSFYGTSIPVRA